MKKSDPSASCMDDFDPDSMDMQQARSLILEQVKVSQPTERLELAKSHGRILAEDMVASIDVPSFRNSAMDGYAFRYPDIQQSGTLTLAGSSLAGHPYTGDIRHGECIKIMTGAPVPDDLDTVVMQENTLVDNSRIIVSAVPAQGSNVRDKGSNIARGTLLLKKHTRLAAAELGLLASIGCEQVCVLQKIRVACFSTGDELVPVGGKPGAGMIYDSNRSMLIGLLQDSAIDVIDLGICRDQQQALIDVMAKCAEADLAISSGGVSVGDADFIKQVLADAGSINLWKIAMKPGRPLTHAVLHSGTQFFGLPGNPVSGMVTFHQFVLPAIDAMLGQAPRLQIEQRARLRTAIRKQPGRVELQRGILSVNEKGEWSVESTGLQDSHVLTSMHRANCYILLDLQSSGAEQDEFVQTLPFSNYWRQV